MTRTLTRLTKRRLERYTKLVTRNPELKNIATWDNRVRTLLLSVPASTRNHIECDFLSALDTLPDDKKRKGYALIALALHAHLVSKKRVAIGEDTVTVRAHIGTCIYAACSVVRDDKGKKINPSKLYDWLQAHAHVRRVAAEQAALAAAQVAEEPTPQPITPQDMFSPEFLQYTQGVSA